MSCLDAAQRYELPIPEFLRDYRIRMRARPAYAETYPLNYGGRAPCRRSEPCRGPLDGIRVLDLTTMVSGPVATMMLADQGRGRDQDRVARGRHHAAIRRHPPGHVGLVPLLQPVQALALRRPQDRRGARHRAQARRDRRMCLSRTSVRARSSAWVSGEDVVRGLKPDIIFVSISGFGESGPYAHQRVYDPVIQALCGLCDIQTDNETGRPHMVRTIVPDKTTSVTAAQAITAALFARERTGKGQHIRLAMLDTMVAYLWPEASSPLTFLDNEPGSGAPAGRARPDLQDGGRLYHRRSDLGRRMGRDVPRIRPRGARSRTRASRPRPARGHNRTERRTIMNEEISKWPTAEILARLDREVVPAAPCAQARRGDRGCAGNPERKSSKCAKIRSSDRCGSPGRRPGSRKPRPRSAPTHPIWGPTTRRFWTSWGTARPRYRASPKQGVVRRRKRKSD